MSFLNKIAVVTGGAMGIGEATARAFHKAGASVAVLDLDASGTTLAKSFGKRGLFARCDVSKAADVKKAFRRIHARFGGVDVLVNNAGIARYATVTESTEKEWDTILGVNLKSAFLCAREAIPSMLKRGGGVVVNVSSVQAFLSQNKVAAYTTSKTALLGLTRSIAVDYAPTVRCVAVCPGTVDTPMTSEVRNDKKVRLLVRPKTAEQTAEKIVACCINRRPELVYGEVPGPLLKLAKLAPGLMDWAVHQVIKRVHPLARKKII